MSYDLAVGLELIPLMKLILLHHSTIKTLSIIANDRAAYACITAADLAIFSYAFSFAADKGIHLLLEHVYIFIIEKMSIQLPLSTEVKLGSAT